MKRGPKLTPAVMVIRMKGLPRRHRIAHLRALIARQPVRSVHREELAALLRDELTAQLGRKPRSMNRPWMPFYLGDYFGTRAEPCIVISPELLAYAAKRTA
jgi:hypothetical protein